VARVVIVGGGQGGFQTAASLRTEGFEGSITIVGDEPHLPYQRPPLSKGMLLGKQQERHAFLRPADFYTTQRIELITSQRVTSIDTQSRRVTLASGTDLEYDYLVLAIGARNRTLLIDGALYVRTLGESLELRQRLTDASTVEVIGGGFIGLEVAAAARMLGKEVTVFEVASRLMARVLAPVLSDYFREQHEARGVRVLLNASGVAPAADLIVAGVGVVPNIELAGEAGLPVANGIQVDEHLRTADPRIFAIGDCAEFPSSYAGARVRLESVQNAVDQAACVAKTIAGRPSHYDAAPWFWSDQFDVHLQMAGLTSGGEDTVTRGDPASGKFSVFYYREGMLKAINSINRPAEHLTARKLIGARVHVTPDQAADESFDLKSAVPQPQS
jgi:3-phenylpropionate/trans-cinnamate dioxygenase ferredoxin reductase subunit